MLEFSSNTPELALEVSSEQIKEIRIEDFFNGQTDVSCLAMIEHALQQDYEYFLRKTPTADVSEKRISFEVSDSPQTAEDFCDFIQGLLACSAPVFSPDFIGHMTSALPKHILPMAKILAATNQNVVKVETSNVFTQLEKDVIAFFHSQCFSLTKNINSLSSDALGSDVSLGHFCSGGTVANLSSLWVARNRALNADVGEIGLMKALKQSPYDDLAILVSGAGHYSLKKAADLLGLGKSNLVVVDTDSAQRMCITDLRSKISILKRKNVKIMAIVGVAGTTETGAIDPLEELGEIANQENCHFHVDAAWGGASLLSNRQRHLFAGIELADSVTIDAHKQLYVPMGAGMVLFKSPLATQSISHHANYIIRKGSNDLGAHTVEGSRGAVAALVASNLAMMGKQGIAKLVDGSIHLAHQFARKVKKNTNFELTSTPTLCIFTYRYAPKSLLALIERLEVSERGVAYQLLDRLNQHIQETQRDTGKGFVSRTKLHVNQGKTLEGTVFRVVLANPLTCIEHLDAILYEQERIASESAELADLNHFVHLTTDGQKPLNTRHK
ncbi:putative pyridoxal-dependent aspartate 1-decarboxylase [Vibrio penaeicida]|uniref:pyridoxal-dependent aspartate 1-decarboxylase PanP n=1 Tax=Vibrio penaeicida TaxID=104609 RepID=UPI00273698DF|nr:putative pyridoxal-dependent aspartate 1-decarboxylase [Vibrio penaeicida]MDP2571020.1 putative pyridoxal-dependent aspartate 1-decarboxylase [Vibrio penaeicida]